MNPTTNLESKYLERYLYWTINLVQRIEQHSTVKEYSLTAKIKDGKPHLVVTCTAANLSYFKLLVKGWSPHEAHEGTSIEEGEDGIASLFIPLPPI